ncbi:DUF2202 domain-containing protein [bacterium]|nr:DUF2202 domain-containing protein [bacterium]
MKKSTRSQLCSLALTSMGVFLIGCGAGAAANDSLTDSAISASYDMTVERGPVLGATVIDAEGKIAIPQGDGVYRFETEPVYPVDATGGYIDVDGDGVITTSDRRLDLPLRSRKGKAITVLTTIAEDSDAKNFLLQSLNLSESDLYNKVPRNSAAIAALSDSIFEDCITNTCVDLKTFGKGRLETLKSALEAEISNYEGAVALGTTSRAIAIDREKAMFARLNTIPNLSANELIDAEEMVNNARHFTIPMRSERSDFISTEIYELTVIQKQDILDVFEDAKVSGNAYFDFAELWKLRVFHHIGRSKDQHSRGLKKLIEKYQLDISNIPTTKGEFSNQERLNDYNTLKTEGTISVEKAIDASIVYETQLLSSITSKEQGASEDVLTVFARIKESLNRNIEAYTRFKTKLSVQ